MKTMAVFALLLAVLGDQKPGMPPDSAEASGQQDPRGQSVRTMRDRAAFINSISAWPTESRMAAENLYGRLGAPDDVTETSVIWYGKPPSRRSSWCAIPCTTTSRFLIRT